MHYVDGYVIALPIANREAYEALAKTSLAEQATRQTSLAEQATRQTSLAEQALVAITDSAMPTSIR